MQKLTNSKTWNALKNHQKDISKTSLRSLFKDKNRFSKFSIETEDILLDYSKNIISNETMNYLINLAQESNIKSKTLDMFQGKNINWTENRPVLHTALRDPSFSPIIINNKNISLDIKRTIAKIKSFTNRVRNGEWKRITGEKIQSIVNVGIGGSDLGPSMITEALSYYNNGPKLYFVSNIDGSDITETLKKLNPEETLFLIASKTFKTQETMTNANTARNWIIKKLGNSAISKHFVAMSTNIEEVINFGINKDNIFTFWDFVGGRYSSWSSIGLPISLSIGFDQFKEFLSGGHDMDTHFRNEEYQNNLPIILGLIGIWYNNFFNCQTHAIFAYDHYLSKFSAHIQQLDMESNGKFIDYNNATVNYETGPIIWGKPGTNGQHAFFQLIHQGTKLIPSDFIGFKKSLNPIGDHHNKLMSNFFAQTKALAFGLTKDEIQKKMASNNNKDSNIFNLIPHRIFAGNKPTNTILINKLTPKSLGKLLALYEHKVFIQGLIWRINSFDQWGVELGKNIANDILKSITKKSISDNDSSTNGLITKFLN